MSHAGTMAATGAGAGSVGGAPSVAGAGAHAGGGAFGVAGTWAGAGGAGRSGAGAGGGTGGVPASGGASAGVAGTSQTPAATCPAAAFCDSFESDALDPARWSIVSPNCSGDGRAEIDRATAHGGTRSLRVTASGGYCNHVFASAMTALPATGPLHGRFFVRFERALTTSHVTFAALRDASEGKDLRMGGQSEILMWNRESDDATLPELSPAGIAMSVKPALGRWLCVEFAIDGARRTLATWVDGTAVPGLQVEGEPTQDVDGQWQRKSDWTPAPSDAKFGWESYGSDANTLWFDDVALGSERFGCDLFSPLDP